MNRLVTILILALSLVVSSCVDEEKGTDHIVKPVEPAATDKTVVLTMQIPGTYTPVTYAYSENDENEVRTVDVLVFRVDSTGRESYYKHIPVTSIAQDNGNTKKIQFKLDLVDSRMIVLANVRNLFTAEMNDRLLTDAAYGDVSKEQVMKRFVFDTSRPFGENFEPIPMYGESGLLRSPDSTVGDIKMVRSITRIDIVNSILDDNITIDSVYLFNTRSKGFVAPAFDAGGAIVGTANVPAEAVPNTRIFGYRFVQNAGTASPAMEREIYVAEDGQDSDRPTGIILKISRQGHPSQFYRVDMCDRNNNLMPILRNYRYRLNITRIIGDGAPTIEMAASVLRPPLSSTVETNELGITSIVFNDLYKLGVSSANLVFRADGSWDGKVAAEDFYSLRVFTTYSGWSAAWESTGDPSGWLEFEKGDFPSSCLELKVKAPANNTGRVRTGKIKLTAGALSIEVNVTQQS
ncbi:MAG: hypothetical protein LBK65_05955 [Tannerellaceae bacterium]|jgi:hypothetical protein|nr:hypothetical protein [Tannerellaceae bacterium]